MSKRNVEGLHIPFDPIAVARTLWKKHWIIYPFTAIFALMGFFVAKKLIRTTYRARAVLIRSEEVEEVAELGALRDMSHIEETLRLFGSMIGLKLPPDKLAKMVKVTTDKRSGLLYVEAEDGNAKKAANIANSYSQAYCATTRRFRRQEALNNFQYFKRRLADTNAQIDKLEKDYSLKKAELGVVDMSKYARSLALQYNHFDALYNEAKARRKEVNLKLEKMASIKKELGERVAKEEAKQKATLRSRTTLRKQVGRLKEKIVKSKRDEEIRLRLVKAKKDYETGKKLYAQGVMSGTVLEARKAQYQNLLNALKATPEITKLQKEIEELDKGIIPKSSSKSQSALILKEMVVQEMELRLEASASKEKISFYKNAKGNINKKMKKLPAIENEFTDIERKLNLLTTYRVELQDKLDISRSAIDTEDTAFHLLQPAIAPTYPTKTKRYVVFAAFTILGFLLGLICLVLFAVYADKLYESEQVEAQLGVLSLGTVTADEATEDDERWLYSRFCDAIGKDLRQCEDCYVLYVSSVRLKDGRTLVSERLASSISKFGLKVALLAADKRGTTKVRETSDFDYMKLPSHAGLDYIASVHFNTLLQMACKDRDIVIIDGPPLRPWVDARVLAKLVHGSVLAIPSGKYRSLGLKILFNRESGPLHRPIGTVLTKVS